MRRLMLFLAVLCAAIPTIAVAAQSGGADRPQATPASARTAPAPEVAAAQAAAQAAARAEAREPASAFRRELRRAFATVRSHRATLGHRVPRRPRLAPAGQRRIQLSRWRSRAEAARADLREAIPHRSAWMCIHSHEGSWTDPNPPYWGGLQMDLSFMDSYGAGLLQRKGTADNWTPEEQMLTAERAWKVRGFTPWPNTARMCGLL